MTRKQNIVWANIQFPPINLHNAPVIINTVKPRPLGRGGCQKTSGQSSIKMSRSKLAKSLVSNDRVLKAKMLLKMR